MGMWCALGVCPRLVDDTAHIPKNRNGKFVQHVRLPACSDRRLHRNLVQIDFEEHRRHIKRYVTILMIRERWARK